MGKIRGCLNENLKTKAEKYLGRGFTQRELRLYPYLTYCFANNGYVDRSKISSEERDIIRLLISEGRIIRERESYFCPTRDFWMFMNECLADSYVTLVEDLVEEK